MIVEVFVSQCDRRDALGEQGLLLVNCEDRVPRVRDDSIDTRTLQGVRPSRQTNSLRCL